MVHLSAGIGGLVAAKVIGRRHGYGTENLSPYDLSLAVMGTGLLWVGWFGFNGGSALAANSRAVMAIIATHLAACAGALTWGAIEWATPAQALGARHDLGRGRGSRHHHAGLRLCRALARHRHRHRRRPDLLLGLHLAQARFHYDDSLDVFGVHGIGGMTGTLLLGVFATASIGGTAGLIEGNPRQLLMQLYGVAVTLRLVGRA